MEIFSESDLLLSRICVYRIVSCQFTLHGITPKIGSKHAKLPEAQAPCSSRCHVHNNQATMRTTCHEAPARIEDVEIMPAMSALQATEDTMTQAILDTGASRCIIGTKPLSLLLQRLPPDVRSHVHQQDSKIKFRFGNGQTLTSLYRVLLPRHGSAQEKVWLGVDVVDGMTPFLFSKRAFKQLGGILDTTRDMCTLLRLQKTIPLSTNATGLYLIDMFAFCKSPAETADVQKDIFVGNVSHVGEITCSEKGPKTLWKPSLTGVSLSRSKQSSSPECRDSSVSPCQQHVESRSCHSHAEGDGQVDHGQPNPGLAVVHEHDRSSESGCHRRGTDASPDQPASHNVPRDDASANASATCGGEPEQDEDCQRHPFGSRVKPDHRSWRSSPHKDWSSEEDEPLDDAFSMVSSVKPNKVMQKVASPEKHSKL